MKSLSSTRLSSAKFAAVAVLAIAGFGVASAAHARSDVVLSIGLQGAPVYYEPAPVYVQPRTVYVAPRPVYVESQPYAYTSYNWERRHHNQWEARRFGPYGDIDHDGIRNRDDRDRDGDGVPNRFDRFPDNGYRR